MLRLVQRFLASGVAVFVAALILFAALALRSAPVQSSDTRFYLSMTEEIERGRGSETFATTRHAAWTVIVFPTLLSLVRAISPGQWQTIMVLLNAVCAAITAAIVVRIVRMVTPSVAAAAAALFFYAAAYDVVAWLHYILTDSIYGLVAIAAFAAVIRGLVRDEPPLRRRVFLAVLLLLCFITRPIGVVLIPLVVFAELLGAGRLRGKVPWLLILAAAVAVLFVRAWFFDDISRWPFDFMRPKLEEYAAREDQGEVVWDRRETFQAPPETLLDHVAIQADRFVRFFQFTTSGFSRMHNLVNAAYYVPLYLLALLGAWRGLRGAGDRRRRVVQVTLLWIVIVAWFHAITILDFDWRYRLPVMPQLILLAALGVEAIAARVAVQPWFARYTRSSA